MDAIDHVAFKDAVRDSLRRADVDIDSVYADALDVCDGTPGATPADAISVALGAAGVGRRTIAAVVRAYAANVAAPRCEGCGSAATVRRAGDPGGMGRPDAFYLCDECNRHHGG